MSNTKDITIEEIKFIEAKAQGKSNTASAMVAKPHIKASSAKKAGNRLSTSANVQYVLAKALKKHKLTIDRALATYDEGLKATKTVIIGKGDDAFADQIPDVGLRMSAGDRVLKLHGITDKPKGQTPPSDNSLAPAILEAIQSGDIEELQRVIFKTDQDQPKDKDAAAG